MVSRRLHQRCQRDGGSDGRLAHCGLCAGDERGRSGYLPRSGDPCGLCGMDVPRPFAGGADHSHAARMHPGAHHRRVRASGGSGNLATGRAWGCLDRICGVATLAPSRVRRTPRACGAAPYRGSHRGSPTRRSASAGRQWRSMRSTLAGTRTLLAGRSACIFLASASAPALFKPPPDCILPSWSRPHFGGCPARWWGSVVSLPVARFVRESVFQGILLVMIAFAGSVCIIRAVESLL